MTPLYRALTRLDAAALADIVKTGKDLDMIGSYSDIHGVKPHASIVARLALPLILCQRNITGDPKAFQRTVEHYACRAGNQLELSADDAIRLTTPGLRDFEYGQVLPVLSGRLMRNDLRDFLNFYPWDLRCLPAVEVIAGWVQS